MIDLYSNYPINEKQDIWVSLFSYDFFHIFCANLEGNPADYLEEFGKIRRLIKKFVLETKQVESLKRQTFLSKPGEEGTFHIAPG